MSTKPAKPAAATRRPRGTARGGERLQWLVDGHLAPLHAGLAVRTSKIPS